MYPGHRPVLSSSPSTSNAVISFPVASQSTEVCAGIGTRYTLIGPGIESRWGARFSAPVHTGPGVQPAFSTICTGSCPGVKRPGRGVDHPPLFSAEVTEGIELYLYSPSGPSWPVLGRDANRLQT
jgi:hypothetical protein